MSQLYMPPVQPKKTLLRVKIFKGIHGYPNLPVPCLKGPLDIADHAALSFTPDWHIRFP